jgi:hypothetical protein
LQAQDTLLTRIKASFSTAETTRLRRYIRSSTTSVYVFLDPHLDPKYIRGRAPGHQVRINNSLRIVLYPELFVTGTGAKNNKKKSELVMKLQNIDESKRLTKLNVQSRTFMKTTQRRRKGTFGITSAAYFFYPSFLG